MGLIVHGHRENAAHWNAKMDAKPNDGKGCLEQAVVWNGVANGKTCEPENVPIEVVPIHAGVSAGLEHAERESVDASR